MNGIMIDLTPSLLGMKEISMSLDDSKLMFRFAATRTPIGGGKFEHSLFLSVFQND